MGILDRRALGRSYLSALEFPRREAEMVQMAATDLRTRVRRRASSKFKFVVHLAAPHRIATHPTCRACAVAVERAARFGYWQSAAQDRFAGCLSEDWLVGHGSPPAIDGPLHGPGLRANQGAP